MVVPWDVLDAHGADAFRWYYFTSKQPWDGYRFSLETVGESVRQFMKTLWNTYGFFVLYANVNDVEPAAPDAVELTDLDRWILSRLQATAEVAIERLDDYDTTTAGRAIAAFVDDLSNWYVRRSRRRFWDGDPAAFATLRHCLVEREQAGRAAHPVRGRRDLRQPRRRRAVGAPVRLPGARRRAARHRARVADGRWRARPWASAARPARTGGSRCASRCARRWWWPPGASATRSSASSRSCWTS